MGHAHKNSRIQELTKNSQIILVFQQLMIELKFITAQETQYNCLLFRI